MLNDVCFMKNGKRIHYIYKIHFLCGYPSGRYYIGRHWHDGDLSRDHYAGSGAFCDAYFKKYGKKNGITYIKEILEINPNHKINLRREKFWVGTLYKDDPLCMNMIPGGVDSSEAAKFKRRKVDQYDLDGNYITTFESQSQAAAAVNVPRSLISNCCRRVWSTAAGYIFRYHGDKLTAEDLNRGKHYVKHPVIQLDLNGNKIAEYESVIEASRSTGFSEGSISRCANGWIKKSCGYIWKYKTDQKRNIVREYSNSKRVFKISANDKSILKIYDSIGKAAKDLGLASTNIRKRCWSRKITDGYYLTFDEPCQN